MRIFILLLSVFATNALATPTDTPQSIDHTILPDEMTRLDSCEHDIKILNGRIELLEHSVLQLQQTVNSLHPSANTASVQPPETTLPAPKADEDIAKKQYDLALAALKDGHFPEAEKLFAQFIKQHSQSPLLSNAYFWYAESFYRREDFEKAALYYLKGYKQNPKSAKASDSLLKLALTLGAMHKTPDACAMLNKLDEEYPKRTEASLKRAKEARAKLGCKAH